MRSKLVSIIVLFLTFLALAASAEMPKREWHQDMTLIVLKDELAATQHAVKSLVNDAGGRIAIISGRVMIGWLSDDAVAAIAGHAGVARATKKEIRASAITDEQSLAAIRYFNWVARGDAGRAFDALPEREMVEHNDVMAPSSEGYRSTGLTVQPLDHGSPHRSAMTGRIVANIFLVQKKTGGRTWTPEARADAVAQIMDGMAFWASRYDRHAPPDDRPEFIFESRLALHENAVDLADLPARDAVSDPHGDVIKSVMKLLCDEKGLAPNCTGWSTPFRSAIEEYNDRLIGAHGARHAFTAFIAYNPQPGSPTTFLRPGDPVRKEAAAYADGHGGAYWVSMWQVDGIANKLAPTAAHETGHTFWACDEYASQCAGCGPCYGPNSIRSDTQLTIGPRPCARNGNCENKADFSSPLCSGLPGSSCYLPQHSKICMMRDDTQAYRNAGIDEKQRLCDFTREQLGWSEVGCFTDVNWDDAGGNSSWQGEYFNNRQALENYAAAFTRADGTGFLNVDIGTGVPSASCLNRTDEFAVRFKRVVQFADTGRYTFSVNVDGRAILYRDGEAVCAENGGTFTCDVAISAGRHEIRLDYFEDAGQARASLQWALAASCPTFTATVSSNGPLGCPGSLVPVHVKITGTNTPPYKVTLRDAVFGITSTHTMTSNEQDVLVTVRPVNNQQHFTVVNVSDRDNCAGVGAGDALVNMSPQPRFPGGSELYIARVTFGGLCENRISWPAATTCDSSAPKYTVRRTPAGGTAEVIANRISALTWTDTTFVRGQRYSYGVTAEDGSGNAQSLSSTETIANDCLTVPSLVITGPETIEEGHSITFNVNLRGLQNAPLVDRRILFNAGSQFSGDSFTDEDGQTSHTITFALSPGSYIVSARFLGIPGQYQEVIVKKTFKVECSYKSLVVAPDAINVKNDAGSMFINVFGNCPFEAVTTDPWLHVSNKTAKGFTLSWDAGGNDSRTGKVVVSTDGSSITGRHVTVKQSAACELRFNPVGAWLPADTQFPGFPAGQPPIFTIHSIDVIASPGCPAWTVTATPGDDWIHLDEAGGGVSGTVKFRTDNNSGNARRTHLTAKAGTATATAFVNQAGVIANLCPQIVIHAEDGHVIDGENVAVRVHATGSGNQYEWRASNSTHGALTSSPAIIIPKGHGWYPDPNGAGVTYSVVVRNSAGTCSDASSVRWTASPRMDNCRIPFIFPHPDMATSPGGGASVTLSINAVHGDGGFDTTAWPLQYQWYHGATGNRGSKVFNGNTRSITVGPSSTEFYWVEVTDPVHPDHPGFCGSQQSGTGAVVITRPPKMRSVSHDFSRDRRGDLLWHHNGTKKNLMWVSNGNNPPINFNLPDHADPNAHIESVGDFNGDEQPDIVWRNATSGENSVWLMDGVRFFRQEPLQEPPLEMPRGSQWSIGGVGDFNGDELHDIVWHNNATGENEIRFLEGTTPAGIWSLPPTPSADWRLHGAADFNFDNKPDLFFHDHKTGANSVWKMDDARPLSKGLTTNSGARPLVSMSVEEIKPLPDTDWKPAVIGDMDGDERPDIVWRHAVSGDIMTWRMVGTSHVATPPIQEQEDLGWEIGGGGGSGTGGGTAPEPGTTPTTLELSATPVQFGGGSVITATLTSNGSPLRSRPVTFRLNGTVLGELLTDDNGEATAAASAAGIARGTYPGAITASFTGDAQYAASSAATDLVVAAAQPVVTWNQPANIVYGTPLGSAQLNATADAAGAFAYTPAAGTVLDAGFHTLSVLFTPSDPSYEPATQTVSIVVTPVVPSLSWSAPVPISYGTPLTSLQLNAASNIAGRFEYDPAPGTVLDAGNQILRATFVPSDSNNVESSTLTTSITVTKGTQKITWLPPSFIVYGQALTPDYLSAFVTGSGPAPAGALTFTPPAGTVLPAGTHTLTASAAETPSYFAAGASAQIKVVKARPAINWSNPASIVYGTALGATQLNATANVAGSFLYTPSAGMVLQAGNGQTLAVTLTPNDTANYESSTATVLIDVLKAKPVVTWAKPASIVYGTALGATQFSATANIAGTFVYTPAAGTILDAGAGQTLSVLFTPNDTNNYEGATASVQIDVAKAKQTITWSSPSPIVYGTALSSAQLNAQVTVVGPSPAGAVTYTPAAGMILQAGNGQTLTVNVAATPNYDPATASVTIDVLKAKPVITWSVPAPIIYGAPLGGAQLNATANVPGSFVYDPAAGTILEAGQQPLSTQFTPTDTHNHENASATVTLEVQQATPVLIWPQPAGIVYGTALGGTQLTATAGVAGEFIYTPASGTILDAGNGQTLSVLFKPADARNYKQASATTTIDVAKAPQELTWVPPAAIFYGTPLTSAQLNAQVSVVGPSAAGALVYASAAGTVLDAGAGQTLVVTAQETANYFSATKSVTIDVNLKPLALVADAKSKLYGAVVPQLTGTLTGVVNNDAITPAYSTTATQQSVVGTYPISATLIDPNQRLRNYDVTITNATLTVLPAPLMISAGMKSKQYSDPMPQLTATFTGLVLGETPAVLGGTLFLQTTATTYSAPGAYPITIGGLTSPNYAITFAGGTLTVTQEDARVTITSPFAFVATGSSTITLSATVKDISATSDAAGDTTAGDIRNATLTFVDRTSNRTLCAATIGLLSPSDERIGVATCSFTHLSAGISAGAVVGGYYIRNDAGDDVTITISQPNGDSITAGGKITLAASVGAKAADANTPASFQLNLQYGKNGALKGNLTFTFERTENGATRTYQISAAPTSLAIRRTANGGTAAIVGTGVLRDVTISTSPVVIDNAAPLIATATDDGEPSTRDAVSMLLLQTDGGVWFAGGWDGTRATEQPVQNGNVQVHYGK